MFSNIANILGGGGVVSGFRVVADMVLWCWECRVGRKIYILWCKGQKQQKLVSSSRFWQLWGRMSMSKWRHYCLAACTYWGWIWWRGDFPECRRENWCWLAGSESCRTKMLVPGDDGVLGRPMPNKWRYEARCASVKVVIVLVVYNIFKLCKYHICGQGRERLRLEGIGGGGGGNGVRD